jgi:hypothetical protein
MRCTTLLPAAHTLTFQTKNDATFKLLNKLSGSPTAMPGALLGLRQMPPDFDHVAHDVLGERSDRAR